MRCISQATILNPVKSLCEDVRSQVFGLLSKTFFPMILLLQDECISLLNGCHENLNGMISGVYHFFHILIHHVFSVTFFLPSALLWHPLWYELCITVLNGDSKNKSPFQHRVHLSLTMLTFTPPSFTLLFLSRFNSMTTDIGSLAAGQDGHVCT
jgi:hypothetical protein